MIPEISTAPDSMYTQLQQMFEDFQNRAERLSKAYETMQEEFGKINIELDNKNSQLKQSLAKQEETQIYLSSILESMNSGVISIDNQGTITIFNKAASTITGYSAQQLQGKKFIDVFPDNSLCEKHLYEVLQTGKGFVTDEKALWHRNGTPVPVSFQSSILLDKNGSQLGAVEIFNDMSRLKALEEEMQHKKTMAALGEMAATVAHEIRNPLGAMGVWAGLLDRDLETHDPRRKILGKLTDALGQLNRIVTNLLVYSRPIKAQLRKVPLQDLMNETVSFMGIEIERYGKNVTIVKKWEETRPLFVKADPEKMQQVIVNLCLNAVQAMPSGGTLTISCQAADQQHDTFVSFSVIDTGIGIEKELLDKIFDPFYTTKENGTGLGLAIVKRFVEFHGGYIQVKSAVGIGTSVRVFLPHITT
ncbi:MAG: PAS domain S-box protein [Chitinivibrionales bacterium]|nr:PAS domain S-box protein [Chitinivibrionales bacterium]